MWLNSGLYIAEWDAASVARKKKEERLKLARRSRSILDQFYWILDGFQCTGVVGTRDGVEIGPLSIGPLSVTRPTRPFTAHNVPSKHHGSPGSHRPPGREAFIRH